MARDPKKEAARTREKYHRLQYKKLHRGTKEQRKAADERQRKKHPYKRSAKHLIFRMVKRGELPRLPKGMHYHHWSYRNEHWHDVITLSNSDHALLHRFMTYDEEARQYRNMDGMLLDEKEDHLFLLEQLKETDEEIPNQH